MKSFESPPFGTFNYTNCSFQAGCENRGFLALESLNGEKNMNNAFLSTWRQKHAAKKEPTDAGRHASASN
jgi:hypothetical protein